MEMYWTYDHNEKIEVELENLRRKHPSKSCFKAEKRMIWDKIMKVVDKHLDHLELIQENIEVVIMVHKEMNSIKKVRGDLPTKARLIINFINHMPKEEVVKANIDKSKWVVRAN